MLDEGRFKAQRIGSCKDSDKRVEFRGEGGGQKGKKPFLMKLKKVVTPVETGVKRISNSLK